MKEVDGRQRLGCVPGRTEVAASAPDSGTIFHLRWSHRSGRPSGGGRTHTRRREPTVKMWRSGMW